MSLINWKKTASLIAHRFPAFIQDDFPLFVAFVAAYQAWLDETTNANYKTANFQNYLDIDLTDSSMLDRFHDEFMSQIPKNVLTDRRLLLKHVRQFYRTRGTEQAAKFLFRIMYNQEVDFYYPSVDLFKPSDSMWLREKSLSLTPYHGYDVGLVEGHTITGVTSGATTAAERVISHYDHHGRLVSEIFYSRASGAFANNEYIAYGNTTVGQIYSDGVYAYPGVYTSWNSHPSGSAKLQDSLFYQDFSYVIRSGMSITEYQPILEELVHPAGTKVFGEYMLTASIDASNTSIALLNFDIEIDAVTGLELVPTFYSPSITSQVVEVTVEYEVNLNSGRAYEPVTLLSTMTRLANTTNIGMLASVGSFTIEQFDGKHTFVASDSPFMNVQVGDVVYITDNANVNQPFRGTVVTVGIANAIATSNSYSSAHLANGTVLNEGQWVIRADVQPYNAITGSFQIANSNWANVYLTQPARNYFSWSNSHFTDGRGAISTSNTHWQIQLRDRQLVTVRDTSGGYANSTNEINVVDSNTTLTLWFSVPNLPFNHGAFTG